VIKFTDLGLPETLLRALQHEGYETPSPIQAQAIPVLMQGRDLLGIAQTGTGKTAAFALPILTRILADRRRMGPGQIRVLVLAPTRELAAQICDSFKAYGRFMNPRLNVGVIVGGVGQGPQIDMLARGMEVLVATPGRLLDHMSTGRAKLDAAEVLVLDEADHMLDLGFIVPIRRIVQKLPKKRQTLLFSATMPNEISGLAADLLNNPAQVSVAPVATTAERVDQHVFFVDGAAKRDVLVELMKDEKVTRAIVFTRTKRGADKVAQHLEAAGVDAHAIHGNKSQNQRVRALDGFKKGQTRVLVATDIASRGIDVDDVSHVFNYELPDTPEAYVHRIGRTARAGASGRAVSLCDNSERPLLRQIEKLTRQVVPSTDRRTAGGARKRADFGTLPSS
jgi:ATP-dependent RNA helicase RhlE